MAVVNNSLQLNDRMTPVLRSIIRALDTTLEAMASVDSVAQKEFQSAQRAIRAASRSVDEFRVSISGAGSQSRQSFIHIVDGAHNADNAMSGLVDQVKALAGAYLGIQGVSKLVQGADTFIGNTARLGLLVKEGEKVQDIQTKIYEASQRSLTNYNDMTNAVAQLGITAAHSFSGNDEIIMFTEQLNKQFKIAGTSAQAQSAAMYQLTQAMASGRLQGDEFRSIMENAPLLAATVAQHMNLTFGQLREASSEGKITADIIKKALLNPEAVEKATKMFNEMPMTFGDLWTQVMNRVNRGLEPLYIRLREMWNNPDMQTFLTQMTNGFVNAINMGIGLFNTLAGIASFLYNNWSMIAPAVYLVVGALTAAKLASMAYNTVIGISTALSTLYTAWLNMQTGGTFAATAAQYGLNAALLACPITWIVLGIAAIIAIIYAVVAAINHFGDTSYSVTGAIAAAVMTLVALIWNALVGLVTAMAQYLDFWSDLVAGVVEFIYNAFTGGFDSIWDGAANLIGNLISSFLQLGKVVTTIIDAMFGTDWTGGLKSLQDKVTKWGKNENALTVEKNLVSNKVKESGLGRMGYAETQSDAYQWGKGKVQDIKDMFKVGDKTYSTMPLDAMNGIAGNTAATADNTKKLTEGINLADEDIELLKETARISFVNRFTTMTPQITATFGDVHETADTKAIMNVIEKSVMDALESSLT